MGNCQMCVLQGSISTIGESRQKWEAVLAAEGSLANGSSQQRCWWIVYTRSGQEKRLAEALADWRISFYLPCVRGDRLPPGAGRSLQPLLPRYLFMFASHMERFTALTTRCISGILPVDDQGRLQQDLLRVHQLIEAEVPPEIEEALPSGQSVRVQNGPLRGIVGRIAQGERLLFGVECVKLAISTKIDGSCLDRA